VRQADLPRVVSALERPIHDFIRESRVRIALLINSAGQVLAQHGFTRSYEVMNVASLAAAAHASARALAQMSEAARWTHMHHAGKERQLFLAPIRTPVVELILVAIFDHDTSLGIVQLFFDRFGKTIANLPELQERMEATTQHTFEGDLQAGLRAIVEPPKGKV
jgi:predicted regulator of Ras-like GTPase activity (Roadblock/LC7/MglB family)